MNTADLPDYYVPSSMREDKSVLREVKYAIGLDDGEAIGYFHGPTPSLKEMLETVPTIEIIGHKRIYIVRFNADVTEEALYEWKINRWELV